MEASEIFVTIISGGLALYVSGIWGQLTSRAIRGFFRATKSRRSYECVQLGVLVVILIVAGGVVGLNIHSLYTTGSLYGNIKGWQ